MVKYSKEERLIILKGAYHTLREKLIKMTRFNEKEFNTFLIFIDEVTKQPQTTVTVKEVCNIFKHRHHPSKNESELITNIFRKLGYHSDGKTTLECHERLEAGKKAERELEAKKRDFRERGITSIDKALEGLEDG